MIDSKPVFLNHKDAALLNKNAVLNFIKNNATVSRTDIWEQMDLSRASVTQIVKQLIKEGLVIETGCGDSTGGRKPHLLRFNKNAKYILVFDWYSKSFCITNLASEVLYKNPVKLDVNINPQDFVLEIVEEVKKAFHIKKLNNEKIIGLGLVMPGIIDPIGGIIKFSAEQRWKNIAIRDMIEESTKIKTFLDRQGNMNAVGEYLYGKNEGVKDFVLVEMEEDGIGMAVIMNGELQRGSNYMIGEFGHIKLLNKGPLCSCGKEGCLEAIIKKLLRENDNKWVDEAVYYIGWGISFIIDMLDPKVIVLSGELVENMSDDTIQSIKKVVVENSIGIKSEEIIIEKSVLGKKAGIKGISGLIYKTIFNEI